MTSRRPIVPGIRTHAEQPEPSDGPTPEELREAFSRWASGVTVVAARDEAHVVAMTATAFVPVSLDPPLVLVCAGANANVLPLLEPGARFAISILAEDQRRLASVFADTAPLGRTHFAAAGDPFVQGALAALACTVRERHAGGDHVIIVAAVERVMAGGDAGPLVFFRREYRALR